MAATPLIDTTLIMRVETPSTAGAFGVLKSAIGDASGIMSAVDTRSVARSTVVRDVSISVSSEAVGDAVGDAVGVAIEGLSDTRIIHISDATFLAHFGARIRIEDKITVKTRADLPIVNTPDVARVCVGVVDAVAGAVRMAVIEEGLARRALSVQDDESMLTAAGK